MRSSWRSARGRGADHLDYPDIDLVLDYDSKGDVFKHRDGTPYPPRA